MLDVDLRGGPYFNIAQNAFEHEPANSHHGVNVNLLKITVANLAQQAARPSARRILYAAAITDLKQLEHATPSDVASSTSSLFNPFVQDVYYLNVFFMTSRL